MAICRICEKNYQPFISFGRMPIANGFLLPEEFNQEYFFELQTGFCESCGMVQLVDQPAAEQMFHENYAFFSGTSVKMQTHFKEFAEHVIKDYLPKENPFVVEIGSNDGIMLQNFAQAGIRHLGIEPSKNVAQVARDKGVNTISEFFNAALAKKIIAEYGQADAYLAANVMCHIPDFHSVIEGISLLVKPTGVVIFEDPYLGEMIEKTSYDQIYDEHVFLFSVASINYAFNKHGMEVIDVEPQVTHGGSMRYIIAHKGRKPVSASVDKQLKKELDLGLNKAQTYQKFGENCQRSKRDLVSLLKKLKTEGKRVVGYAATSKSTTVLNYCGIGPDLIEFISDTTPIKQGKFSPGSHIPVKPYTEFQKNYPDYALLFAWNHQQEIMAKEQAFKNNGGKWIFFVPSVEVV